MSKASECHKTYMVVLTVECDGSAKEVQAAILGALSLRQPDGTTVTRVTVTKNARVVSTVRL